MSMPFAIGDPIGPLLTLSAVILVGVACGAGARRLGLPSVTGQIIAGLAMGQAGLAVFSPEDLHGLEPLTHLALGLIAVTVGGPEDTAPVAEDDEDFDTEESGTSGAAPAAKPARKKKDPNTVAQG